MASFEYKAVDTNGKNRKGFIDGDSLRHARQLLKEQGLLPINVIQVEGERSKDSQKTLVKNFSRSKLNTTDLALITRQFATLLDSGLTIEEVLTVLIAQAEKHKIKSILTGVRSNIIEGQSFSDSVNQYPNSFPEIYRAAVSAGEHSGKLAMVMDNLANFLEERQSLQQRLSIALVYPIVLVVVSILIIIALLRFVVPKIVVVFEGANQTLPILTQIMITLSEFLKEHSILLVLLVIIIVLCLRYLFRQQKPRLWLDGWILRLPLTRRLSREVNSARLSRTLSIMIESGVPLLTAMRSAEGVMSNQILRQELQKSALDVSEGSSIHRSLQRNNRFSPLMIQMIASGEASGKLGEMLNKSANALEVGVKNRLAIIMGLLEPMIILVMGGLVMLIVLAILLPIFDMNTLIN